MRKIAVDAVSEPDKVKGAPYTTPVTHPDEDEAALNPIVKFKDL